MRFFFIIYISIGKILVARFTHEVLPSSKDATEKHFLLPEEPVSAEDEQSGNDNESVKEHLGRSIDAGRTHVAIHF